MNAVSYLEKFKKELLESCVPFWINNGFDEQYGGVLNCLDRKGKVYSTDKSVWMQGRAAWTFSYLYNNIEKNEDFLKIAKSCLEFLDNHCIDTDGRMFFTVTRDGKPLRKRRYWFSETFYIIANAEYAMATGDKSRLQIARDKFKFVCGIYDDPQTDPYKITPKSYAETRALKGLSQPMILLNVASILRGADKENSDYYTREIDKFIQDIQSHYCEEKQALLESVGVDGSFIFDVSESRIVNPGHDIECSWFLLEEGIYRNDEKLISFAEKIFRNAIEFGWDLEYGGILYFKDVNGNPVEAYEHDMKLWWPHNEAMIASLMLYKQTNDCYYSDWFEKITEYSFDKFSDPEYGEWFGYLRRDGKPTMPPCKGHTYKGPFHTMRMLAKCCLLLQD
ncbi:MAG: AGE family epimerase/isomerase [Clostridia bacterium]|nr:AGE family epimerase/isomerase [Clostridia bacterium]